MRRCEVCGKPLSASANSRRKYCSPECAKIAKAKKASIKRQAKKIAQLSDDEPAVVSKPVRKSAKGKKAVKTIDKVVETPMQDIAKDIIDTSKPESKTGKCGRCGMSLDPNLSAAMLAFKKPDGDIKKYKLCPHCVHALKGFMDLGKVAGELARMDKNN